MMRARRALARGPRYVLHRAAEAARSRARRPWSRLYPKLLTDAAFLRTVGAGSIDNFWAQQQQQPFFFSVTDRHDHVQVFEQRFNEWRGTTVAAADRVLAHEFDLLGSGPKALGPALPWHEDFKTGRRWPLDYGTDIQYNELDRPSDVKVPWELSRCQHFTRLGQAYWLTGDDRYAAEFAAETLDWIAANPYAYGVNWACAMDVALRAVSWIWGFHYMSDAPACRGRAFRLAFMRALFLHGEFVATHLERADLNGNHFLCDGVGLVFLGTFFQGARRASGWLATGRAIVEQEIFNQTTADGVDFEQSTAYHRLVLEAFLTSYELLRRHRHTVPPESLARLERMCEFVQAYTKPDGRAPLVGDADNGRVQVLGFQDVNDHRYLLSSAAALFNRGDFKAAAGRCSEETFWLLGPDGCRRFDNCSDEPAPSKSIAFPDGGVYVLRSPGTHLIVDCADVGMKGRGGHGHNDILSFELFFNGRNLISDCGAYLYTASREWRNAFRSTAFHNTVQVDGEELNRFISPDALWQLRYDATPVDPALVRGTCSDGFRGGHRGYARLTSAVAHTRECFVHHATPRVLVRDLLEGDGEHSLIWRFHLDPAVAPVVEGSDVRLSVDGQTAWLLPDVSDRFALSLEPGWISPAYGVKVPTTVLVWRGVSTMPVVASYLFSESRLEPGERSTVCRALATAS